VSVCGDVPPLFPFVRPFPLSLFSSGPSFSRFLVCSFPFLFEVNFAFPFSLSFLVSWVRGALGVLSCSFFVLTFRSLRSLCFAFSCLGAAQFSVVTFWAGAFGGLSHLHIALLMDFRSRYLMGPDRLAALGPTPHFFPPFTFF
jgi:hypothetical protein